MGIGQLILLGGVVIFAVYATRLRSRLTDHLAYLVLAFTALVLVIRPEWSTRLAQLVGIGRGADLVFYVFIVFSLFSFVAAAANRRRLERDLTSVVRVLALHDPRMGDSSGNGSTESSEALTQGSSEDVAPSPTGREPKVTQASPGQS